MTPEQYWGTLSFEQQERYLAFAATVAKGGYLPSGPGAKVPDVTEIAIKMAASDFMKNKQQLEGTADASDHTEI